MKTFVACLALLATMTAAAAQNQTTFRDASGRTIGTATTDSQGTRHSGCWRANDGHVHIQQSGKRGRHNHIPRC